MGICCHKPDGGGYDQSSIDATIFLAALEADHILDKVDAGDASPEGRIKGREEESRGLALATFGLGFTVAVGPLLGGHLANVEDNGKGQGGEVSVRCRDSCKHA
eukprot:scaffold3001_cov98-Skeletonema_marinoi.AAC.2